MARVKVSYWNRIGKPVALVGEIVEVYTDGTFAVIEKKTSKEVAHIVYPNDREGDKGLVIEGVE